MWESTLKNWPNTFDYMVHMDKSWSLIIEIKAIEAPSWSLRVKSYNVTIHFFICLLNDICDFFPVVISKAFGSKLEKKLSIWKSDSFNPIIPQTGQHCHTDLSFLEINWIVASMWFYARNKFCVHKPDSSGWSS